METIRTQGALVDNRKEERQAPKLAREQPADAIRTLQEWELALAGGGEFVADWG
jgi:hypothetical protein